MNAISSTIGATVAVLITLVIFAIGLAIERIAPAAPIESIRLNVIYGIFRGFVGSAAAPLLAGVSFFSTGVAGGGLITLPSEGWRVVFSSIVYLLVLDFAEYLFHRAQHAVPFLWALHSPIIVIAL